jgi:hypothetical protein
VTIVKHQPLYLRLLAITICLSSSQPVFAHRPIFTDDAATSFETAIQVTEPGTSQLVYREITDKMPQVWLTFTAPKDFALFIQIGVPVIDRLKDFCPVMVVVGPGLQGESVPLKIPENTGAKAFSTHDVAKPRFFQEHFTGTDSWILRSETVKLSEPGRYYVVAFSPQKQTGKLWVSIGKKESFSLDDLKEFPAWRKRIQEFHEVKRKVTTNGVAPTQSPEGEGVAK